jgi:hypothetical protein
VSENVNAFNVKQVRIKLPSANNNEVQLNAENGFAIHVPCIQKVFKFYTRYRYNLLKFYIMLELYLYLNILRNQQEKRKWLEMFESVAHVNKTEIDRVSFFQLIQQFYLLLSRFSFILSQILA